MSRLSHAATATATGQLDTGGAREYRKFAASSLWKAPVRTGLDVLRDRDFALLRGQRVGLVCHPASVDSRLRHAADLLAAAPGVQLAALFGPEHGFAGTAQDLIGVGYSAEG